MELGLTDHIWSIAELIEQAKAAPQIEPVPPPVRQPVRLRVLRGGRKIR